jgi:hypothetical protein
MKLFDKLSKNICFLSLFFLASCGGTNITKSYQGKPFNANFDVRLFWSDFEYIDEIEAEITYTQYFGGLFRFYNEGRFNNRQTVTYLNFNGANFLPINGLLINNNAYIARALYDAVEKHPEAEFVIPISTKTETVSMFLGSKRKFTVRAKLYKMKKN